MPEERAESGREVGVEGTPGLSTASYRLVSKELGLSRSAEWTEFQTGKLDRVKPQTGHSNPRMEYEQAIKIIN